MSDKKEIVIAVDPGNTETAMVICEKDTKNVLFHAKLINVDVLLKLMECKALYPDERYDVVLVVEMVASYGMPVGRSIFDTCVWIGRFMEAWGGKYRLVVRKDVKMNLCHSTKAKDSNIRQALMDRFGSTKEAAIGTKKNPGPMYGMGNDERAALALAFTAIETSCSYTLGLDTSKKAKPEPEEEG